MRAEAKRSEARVRAQGLMSRMRSEAQQGQAHLAIAKQEAEQAGPGPGNRARSSQPWEPGGSGGAGAGSSSSAGGSNHPAAAGHAQAAHGGAEQQQQVGATAHGQLTGVERPVMDLMQASLPSPSSATPTSIQVRRVAHTTCTMLSGGGVSVRVFFITYPCCAAGLCMPSLVHTCLGMCASHVPDARRPC